MRPNAISRESEAGVCGRLVSERGTHGLGVWRLRITVVAAQVATRIPRTDGAVRVRSASKEERELRDDRKRDQKAQRRSHRDWKEAKRSIAIETPTATTFNPEN